MSKVKEAIELLEHNIAVSRVSADNENYLIKVTIGEGERILALLRPLAEPKCKTCGDKPRGVPAKDGGWTTCPDCQAKPEASGIGNTLRDIAEESTLNPAERKSLRLIAKEYDSQAAELDKANQEARDRLVRADTLAAEKAELEAENKKLAEHLLRVDNYCRVNDIDLESILEEE